ncbi:hypothetical protein BDZ97DRAFT_1817925 [Flammula alnicola]|nr:hypothetical protein BDZ97DRAFT_1817925 [Flammula alnicola]
MNFPQGATTPGHTDIHDQIRSQPCQVERNDSSVGELVPSPSVQDAGRVSEVQPSPNSILQSSSNLDINGGQFISSGGAHVTVTINANHIPVDGTRDLHQYTNPSTHPEERHQDVASSQATRANSGTGTRDLPVQKSCDVYYRHLAVKGRGYPLWIPEPNNQLPPIYQRQGIAVGDVGIITPSGSFDFLFNICLPRDHPVNSSEVPDDFTPVNPPLGGRDIRVHQEFRHGSYVASGSIKRSLLQGGDSPGLTFETSASEGALLTMPDGATSSDLRNISRFRHYASANAESWYRFANGPLGCEAKNGDIRLVVGCDKATAWGMATFSNLTEQNDFRLKFKSTTQNSSDPMYYWEYSGSADVRAGPDSWEIEVLRRDDPDRPITYKNQCLFIRTLNPTLREDVWSKLSCDLGALYIQDDLSHATSSLFPPATCIGSTKPSVPPRDDHGPDVPFYSEGTARSVLISESPVAMTAHPSKIINETLLNLNSQAKIVITEDRDWLSVITEVQKLWLPHNANHI